MDGGSQLAVERSSDGGLAELYTRYVQSAVRLAFLLTGDDRRPKTSPTRRSCAASAGSGIFARTRRSTLISVAPW